MLIAVLFRMYRLNLWETNLLFSGWGRECGSHSTCELMKDVPNCWYLLLLNPLKEGRQSHSSACAEIDIVLAMDWGLPNASVKLQKTVFNFLFSDFVDPSEGDQANALGFEFLTGSKTTLLASKTSRKFYQY